MHKIKTLTKKEWLAIEGFKDSLLDKFPKGITRIILFGSKARGTSNRFSDIDLLVVFKRNGKRIAQETAMLTHHPIARYMVDISPISVEEGFFTKWSPLLEKIEKEGIVLWTEKKARKNI